MSPHFSHFHKLDELWLGPNLFPSIIDALRQCEHAPWVVHPTRPSFRDPAESRTGDSRQGNTKTSAKIRISLSTSSGNGVARGRSSNSTVASTRRIGFSVSHRSDRWCGRAVANTSVLSSSSTTGTESAGIEQMIDMTVVVDIVAANAGGIPQTDGSGIVSSHIESDVQR